MRLPAVSLLAATLLWPGLLFAEEAPTILPADRHRTELDAVTRDIALTRERQEELRREIDSLDKDQATLTRSLVDAGQQVTKLEGDIDQAERRLEGLLADEDKLRASLAERRGVLAEVLAALQRMGHRPPPVILVRPDDALASIRSAILLGAVVPDLRVAADALLGDLQKLVAVRRKQEQERDRLRENATALAEGRERITLLIAERQKQKAASVEALVAEERRAADLAGQASSLRDLIAKMETENATAAAAAAAAEHAAAIARTEEGNRPAKSLGAPGRLTPSVAFVNAKGLLPFPANGQQIRGFGESDGLGGTSQGVSIRTRDGAQISSPTDGWVVYSGPFRSYGQLLIINAGDGYHVLLAGLERIDVQLGQFVLAGEPVAVMASTKLASAGAVDVGAAQPVLYIEFRKDGASIDPAPWWATSNVEKVGG
jgi:septal ring factor EnvC (AmiA/AmiB activator)